MSCDETRELLSAWLDEALDARERAAVDAHVHGCAECRRELERLRATVSLLARVEPARAPAGFVDKVVAKAHPTPWYVRLGRVVFLPLSIKLPIEAGAMVVVALLGVYLLQTTPELKDAARQDAPAPATRPEPPPPVPSPAAPASVPSSAPPPAPERDAPLRKAVPPAATRDKRESANMASPAEQAQAIPEKRKEVEQEATAPAAPAMPDRAKAAGPLPRTAAPASPPSPEAGRDRADADRKGALAAPPAASSTMSARQHAAPPLVAGALTVKDKPEAERALASLIARSGAQELDRRQDGRVTVVDVLVPQAAYGTFVKDLAELGSLRIDGSPAEMPPLVRLSVRISE